MKHSIKPLPLLDKKCDNPISMRSKLSVIVADPCFDHKGLRIACMPLGAGLVASYAQKYVPGDLELRVYKAVTPLLKSIKETPPDVLGLTNYVWNKNLCLAVAEYAREINPEVLIVFGGPEMDPKPPESEYFKKKYAGVDLFIQHEGEVAFTKILENYLKLDRNIQKLRVSLPELGNTFLIDSNGDFQESPKLARIDELDDIPSPYTTGLFDHFLSDEEYFPLIQTNRGCPYTCTFCQEGSSYFTKFKRHSLDYIRAELNYIAERVNPKSTLWISDSNWAMFKWDEDTAHHIASLQKETGFPSEIISSTGKSNLDRIIRITKILNHTMYISNSVQSMNMDVLKAVNRKNLSAKELEKNKDEMKNVRQEPEMIIPLPGESKETFFGGINKLIDSGGNQRFAVFQTLVLTNTELAHSSTIEKYGFEIKHKQHFSLTGQVNGKFVCETERVVSKTNTMSTEEIGDCRTYAMLIDTLVRFEPIYEVFRYLESRKIPFSHYTQAFFDSIKASPPELRDCVLDFHRDFLAEMHDDEPSVISYMKKNESAYENGEKGGGILRYSLKFWIDHFSLTFDWIFKILEDVSVNHDPSPERVREIDNLKRYLSSLYEDRIDPRVLDKEKEVTFDYHLRYWSETKEVMPLGRFLGQTTYRFKRTPVSNMTPLDLWQNWGFKREMGQKRKLQGYTNRLHTARLRRELETVKSDIQIDDQTSIERHWVGKLSY